MNLSQQKMKGISSELSCPVFLSIWLKKIKEELCQIFATLLSYTLSSAKNKKCCKICHFVLFAHQTKQEIAAYVADTCHYFILSVKHAQE